MTELNLQVSNDYDDIWLQYSAPNKTIKVCPAPYCPPYIFAGESSINVRYGCGVRFRNVTIPNSATIVSAYLTFNAMAALSTTVCNTRIWGEAEDNPGSFEGETATTAFTRRDDQTTAKVDWDAIDAWTENTEYNSPELKTIIQEIVNRAGWRTGNALVLFWDDTKDARSTTATRAAHSYNDDNARAAKLYINYGAGTGYPSIYPSDAQTRVTSLTHRYDRGTYTLEVNLGEVTADFGLPEWESEPKPSVGPTPEEKQAFQEDEARRLRISPRVSEAEEELREADPRLWRERDRIVREEEARRQEALARSREQDARLWEANERVKREQEEAKRKLAEEVTRLQEVSEPLETRTENYVCPHCGSRFSTSMALARHIESSHPTESAYGRGIYGGGL